MHLFDLPGTSGPEVQVYLGRPLYHEIDNCGIQGRQIEKQAAGGVASWPIAD